MRGDGRKVEKSQGGAVRVSGRNERGLGCC